MRLSISRPLNAVPKLKALAAVSLVLASDFLFFDQRTGLNVAIFIALLAVTIFFTEQMAGRGRKSFFSSLLFCGLAVISLAENISWISVVLAVAGVSTLAVNLKLPWYLDVVSWAREVLRFVGSAPGRVFKDVRLFRKLRKRAGTSIVPGGLMSWIIPITMTAIFAYLFALANPLMDRFFASLFAAPDTEVIPVGRLFLWLMMLLVVWPFFSRHVMKPKSHEPVPAFTSDRSYTLLEHLLTPQSIIRSLVMFNVLFAFQLAFDFTYLFAGAKLPDGMNFASYAHRGAYPLLATVLLAAVFVLITMSRGSKTEHNRLIRTLVYIWIGQNVLLTFGSIDRLWLYVSAYSLTYWRVAALIWMGLVAIGLVLIVVRLWRDYSNNWLLNSNMINLVATLFVCAFVNFGGQIAWFNVQQERQVDLRYLQRIGASALPAVKWLQGRRTAMNSNQRRGLDAISRRLELNVQALSGRNWRELTWRDQRLVSLLANQQATVQKKITISKFQGGL